MIVSTGLNFREDMYYPLSLIISENRLKLLKNIICFSYRLYNFKNKKKAPILLEKEGIEMKNTFFVAIILTCIFVCAVFATGYINDIASILLLAIGATVTLLTGYINHKI